MATSIVALFSSVVFIAIVSLKMMFNEGSEQEIEDQLYLEFPTMSLAKALVHLSQVLLSCTVVLERFVCS